MKVLILSHSSELDGAEQSMLGLFDYWCKETNIEPEFIIRKPLHKMAVEMRNRGYKYHALYYTNWAQRSPTKEPIDVYWYAKQNTKAVAKIERIIKEIKPSLVMTNTIVAPWAAIAAHNQNIPHVWFIREFGKEDHGFEFRIGRDKTLKTIGELSDLVVANSKALAQFAGLYVDKTKISILYPLLDYEKIRQLAKNKISSPFKDPDSLKLVITGRIAPSKGQSLAAEAVGILNKQGIKCELCIVGNPSNVADGASLKSVIKNYNITDNIHLVGYQQNPLAYVALADIGIMASSQEAFGRATLEYMILGKAIVGVNSGATPELIEPNGNGFLFNKNDPNGLAEALLKYANDKQLIYKHGKAAKQKAQLLQEEYNADNLYQKLMTILKGKQKAPHYSEALIEQATRYPVMLRPDSRRPHLKNPMRRLYLDAKHLLKSLYINLPS